MKMCQELSEERKKSSSDKNIIRVLNESRIEHKEIKNKVLNTIKVIDDSTNKVLNSECANPCKITSLWLIDERNNVVTEIEIENSLNYRDVDPEVKKYLSIVNEWNKRQ